MKDSQNKELTIKRREIEKWKGRFRGKENTSERLQIMIKKKKVKHLS